MIKDNFKKVSAEIPQTSLSDIIFILLLFFMATTTFQNYEKLINPDLPVAKALEKLENKKDVVQILIDKNKIIQIDNNIVDKTEIEKLIKVKVEENPNLIISLKIDKDLEMNYITEIQKKIRKAGCTRINYSLLEQN
ncbi:MAG TPA: biopolymer transporter ExbD [Ignavibacteriales bacterium]|jgi:biopolymer transport protein ExbD|nr:biopolymer transporter ExbD [Ignavibacteriales bacterium]